MKAETLTMKEYEITNVLVPIDFSPESLNALEIAVAIGQRQHASLMLIHIIENGYIFFPEMGENFGKTFLPELLTEMNKKLKEIADEIIAKHNLAVSGVALLGNVADEICELAYEKKIDMIVMGTHGMSGLREFFIGSNAYRVVKNSSCPVMTIPGQSRWRDFQRVLFPVRIIPHALDKYEVLRPILKKNGSALLIAGIVNKNSANELSEMNLLIETIRKELAEDEVIYETEIYRCENLARQVLDIANLERPDLIVITATLDTSIKEFFLGPYTQEIVNHAQFPVLSIRPNSR